MSDKLISFVYSNLDNISPWIIADLFTNSLNLTERHSTGIYFTSREDILNIVRPTISDYWEERIEAASTIGELNTLQMELCSYRHQSN